MNGTITTTAVTEALCHCEHPWEWHHVNGPCIACYLKARRDEGNAAEACHPFVPHVRVKDVPTGEHRMGEPAPLSLIHHN